MTKEAGLCVEEGAPGLRHDAADPAEGRVDGRGVDGCRLVRCAASHRSRCTCSRSQKPEEVPCASARRRSMSAASAACPCRMRDSITRLMPMCAAKALWLIPRSTSQPDRIPPGLQKGKPRPARN